MTALPALALSLLAATGACLPACSPSGTPLPEVGEAGDEIVAAGGDAREQVDQATPTVDERLPGDPLAVLDELAATHLPAREGERLRLAAASPAAPAVDEPEPARGDEPAPSEPAASAPESHVVRDDPAPQAQGDSRHAAPTWPTAQGEPAGPASSQVVASLLVGLAAVGLYHKLSKDRALEHPARQRILSLLAEEPGLGTTDVADELDVAYRTARHHLEVLARFDLVVSAKRRDRWRWARPEDADRLAEPEIPAMQERLLALLEEEPGLHLSELARRLDAAKATVKHHLDRLDEREAVEDEHVGPVRRFFPVDSRTEETASP